jgi:hypothetical protein
MMRQMRGTRDTWVLPSKVLRSMRREDQACYGKAGPLREEAVGTANHRSKIEEHRIFLNWCKLNGLPRIYSRLQRRVTIELGWPDFSVFYGGLTIFFQFKIATRLSRDGELTIGVLREVGFEIFIVNSAAEAISIATEAFGL